MNAFNQIQIETTTACNASCPMCPREKAERGGGTMSTEMFWNVVDDAVKLGVQHIVPFINGDPFADKRMPVFIYELAARYPHINVIIYTNGSLITKEGAEMVMAAGNVGTFNVSMQGGDKETLERNMGISWDDVMRNMDMLIEMAETYKRPKIRANMCIFSKTEHTKQAFIDRWQGRAEICLGTFSNFGGMTHDPAESATREWKRLLCDRGTKHIYVYWNGDVGQCCFDLLGSVVHGNVREQSLIEVVKGASFLRAREAHYALDVANMPKICHACNACKFHG